MALVLKEREVVEATAGRRDFERRLVEERKRLTAREEAIERNRFVADKDCLEILQNLSLCVEGTVGWVVFKGVNERK
jgi:hypothetical protein